jgi:hypothetical protein
MLNEGRILVREHYDILIYPPTIPTCQLGSSHENNSPHSWCSLLVQKETIQILYKKKIVLVYFHLKDWLRFAFVQLPSLRAFSGLTWLSRQHLSRTFKVIYTSYSPQGEGVTKGQVLDRLKSM